MFADHGKQYIFSLMNDSPFAGIDLLALLAEVSAPDFLEKNPEVAAAIAADEAAEAARKARSAARSNPATRCGKCCGTGHLPAFRHISNGDCFACDATGIAAMGI